MRSSLFYLTEGGSFRGAEKKYSLEGPSLGFSVDIVHLQLPKENLHRTRPHSLLKPSCEFQASGDSRFTFTS